MEIWVPAFGYEGLYSVSSIGRVRSEDRVVRHFSGGPKRLKGRIQAQSLSTTGYLYLTLSKENIRTKHRVHRLMMQSFTRQNFPLDVMHLDGSRTNNVIENLAWGTRKDNMQDCIKHGRTTRGNKQWNVKLDEDKIRAIRSDNRKQKEIADEYGIHQSHVCDIKKRKRWAYVE